MEIALHTDDVTNAMDYLENAHRSIHETKNNPFSWKWAAISLHGALYGFAVATFGEDGRKHILNKNDWLDSIDTVLKKCQNSGYFQNRHGCKSLKFTVSQQKSIRFLVKNIRNELLHFPPQGWTLIFDGIVDIFSDVLDSIRGIVICRPIDSYLLDGLALRERVEMLVEQSKQLLLFSELHRNRSESI